MKKINITKPLIGICVSNEKPMMVKLAKRRIVSFDENAQLITFMINDADFKNLRVKGEAWNKEDQEWIQGRFPFPDVIYIQAPLPLHTINKMKQITGHRVFNSFVFDKWEGWELLASDKEVKKHLPETKKLLNKRDLKKFLFRHKEVFLKPINGSTSKGIVRIKLDDQKGIEAFYRIKKTIMKHDRFPNFINFWKWFSNKFFNEKYLMQQSIQPFKWRNKPTDIRINLTKNKDGKWEEALSLLRVASNDSHIIPGLLTAFPLQYFNTTYKNLGKDLEWIEPAAKELGYKICKALDNSGHHIGDIGIDMGLDEQKNLWVYEVNSLPFPLPGVKDVSMTRPLEYAQYLASN
ncbi:YheC/YheD family protein [Pseudalkalibacillus caeni]|uniref:ATP-grasp domain-containing protein n=1 Tax=Exobacillus caeni TaxID=2574798 RepID=A0A5R9F328_9BACL|nr:YheC/YheD family protein [Pseudalkalibacillus caeni]TLS36899.1 hypothetical protein FCL54_13160 [Pseudalkalibacillus caeni]